MTEVHTACQFALILSAHSVFIRMQNGRMMRMPEFNHFIHVCAKALRGPEKEGATWNNKRRETSGKFA